LAPSGDASEKKARKGPPPRKYPDPPFALRVMAGKPGGRRSFEIRQKLEVVEYTRMICEDGDPVGIHGASKVLDLDRKLIGDWEAKEGEMQRAVKDASSRDRKCSLHSGPKNYIAFYRYPWGKAFHPGGISRKNSYAGGTIMQNGFFFL